MRDLSWIRCFCCFSCAFHRKCWFSYKKYWFSWKPTKPGQYVCIHVPFTHTCTTKYYQNMIYLVGLLSVLYERPGQNERSVLNKVFLLFFGCFPVLFMKSTTFHTKSATFHENKQNHVNMCVYMYHLHIYAPHTPPNTTMLPSVLSKNQVKMRDLCWISCFCWFSVLFIQSASFIQKVPLFMKTNKTRSICVYTCTTTYQEKLIYLVGFPSVLYEGPGQNERPVLNQMFLLLFRCFSVLSMCFSWTAPHFI